MTGPVIRQLTMAEVEQLIGWAAAEGWNPGLDDAAVFQAADAGGFLGAFAEGEMAAGISAVRYGEDFGFIGLYICHPDFRGQGYGKTVWNAGLKHLEGRTIGLDGVPEQQANYRSMGFVSQYRTIRYSGHSARTDKAGGIRPLESADMPAVEAFDRAYFPAPRTGFLRQWLTRPRRALAAFEGSTLRGYGVARPCREGWKIGPLFAEDTAVAGSLFAALAEGCEGGIHIDVPETAGDFIRFLEDAGFAPGFETSRMYRGPAPAIRLDGVFGITTLELG